MTTHRLVADEVWFRYPNADGPALRAVSLPVQANALTAIIGPNACGKSTLLRTLAGVAKPSGGAVRLDGVDISRIGAKTLARSVAMMSQSAVAPPDITVGDLVSRGRYPHQSILRQWSAADSVAVESALERTSLQPLTQRRVAELSGGQRQRAWIAMSLAQEPEVLLLDEPTTFLDVAHQIDVLELCRALVDDEGKTLGLVIHDLQHACRYADQIVVMKDGEIRAQGPPSEVVTAQIVREVFGIESRVIADPETGTPLVIAMATQRLLARSSRSDGAQISLGPRAE